MYFPNPEDTRKKERPTWSSLWSVAKREDYEVSKWKLTFLKWLVSFAWLFPHIYVWLLPFFRSIRGKWKATRMPHIFYDLGSHCSGCHQQWLRVWFPPHVEKPFVSEHKVAPAVALTGISRVTPGNSFPVSTGYLCTFTGEMSTQALRPFSVKLFVLWLPCVTDFEFRASVVFLFLLLPGNLFSYV